MSDTASDEELEALISFESTVDRLELEDPTHVYVLMSEAEMPGWLVDGEWQFHPDELDDWLGEMGGLEGVHGHLDDWRTRQ